MQLFFSNIKGFSCWIKAFLNTVQAVGHHVCQPPLWEGKKTPPENLVIPNQKPSVNMQRNHDYITRKEKKKRIEQKEVNILEEKRNGDDGKSG